MKKILFVFMLLFIAVVSYNFGKKSKCPPPKVVKTVYHQHAKKPYAKRARLIVKAPKHSVPEKPELNYKVIEPPADLIPAAAAPVPVPVPEPPPTRIIYVQREPNPFEIIAAQRMQTPMAYAHYQQHGAYGY